MRGSAAILGTAALIAATLAVSTAGAAPARSAKLSLSEQRWARPMIAVWNGANRNLHLVLPEAAAKNAFIPGSRDNALLTASLAVFASCSGQVKQAGRPPSARLTAFAASMKRMCAHLGTGAHQMAKAIGAVRKHNARLAASRLTEATSQFGQATRFLAAAQHQLLQVGGREAFVA